MRRLSRSAPKGKGEVDEDGAVAEAEVDLVLANRSRKDGAEEDAVVVG